MRVGFIGAGRMGAPMVKRLVGAGHEVRALGRTDERRSTIAALGATPVTHPNDVTDGADVVVVCVFTDDQVHEVAADLIAAMSPGSVLVLHTTGSPRTAESLAEQAAAHGVHVIDAPVSGGPHDVSAGTVTLWVGGADDALRRARPMLSAYADPVLHVGPIGFGQKVKLVASVSRRRRCSRPFPTAAAQARRWATSRGPAQRPRSSARSASSSARTLRSFDGPRPNSARISADSTNS